MAFPTNVLGVLIALASGFTLIYSVDSISRLKKYDDLEEKANKAAEWSLTAEKKLRDLQLTLATGLVCCLLSAVSGLAFSFSVAPGPGFVAVAWPVLLAAGLAYGRQFVRGFWASKIKVPKMKHFNEAISDMMMVQSMMKPLAGAWGLVAVCKLVGL
ncbi:hypothetical protein CGRA01v4_09966 [Colletotrichum graminicola]|uniref:Uncharacterized protein n=1 Tax=Colletotrichum graminicola (strain M1.001 / M2 / FGSC 10212) TaxID=645133 RepID=E3QHT5_COLGM|nr:uncharacterized protein GLRG_05567 [Colletotrichum graminicola M1.001]EFQ30423.1 hypothetical protein GLRG_05567 [Colletotrichum graminicola M1.001]WDK18681.1 hypothetical protein CGRA01v4_09966 [Colletotrichum graminicola]